jgi:hypothetical protein
MMINAERFEGDVIFPVILVAKFFEICNFATDPYDLEIPDLFSFPEYRKALRICRENP